jgi:hypothetical protein
MHTPESIFVTDGFPEHTYVPINQGEKEIELREGLEQQNKILSISGPSKSGKTTLCDQVFGTSKGADRIYVTGDTVEKAEDLWREAYRQVTDDTDKGFYELSQAERIDCLIESELPLIIDDFHYIPRDVQALISRQLKNAASGGLRIVCLSVPHRGDDPIRGNPDLAGRFFSVNFDYWTVEDLEKIASTGFPLVGFPNEPSFNRLLASESVRSPQLMQTLCLEACRAQNQDTPFEQLVVSGEMLPEIRRRTLRSYNYQTSYDILKAGPPTRGSERIEYSTKDGTKVDVYECLLLALAMDPPFLTIGLDELRQRIQSFLIGDKDPNIRSALQNYEKLFLNQQCPLDWDDEKRTLSISDPHFYFYLRNTNSIRVG